MQQTYDIGSKGDVRFLDENCYFPDGSTIASRWKKASKLPMGFKPPGGMTVFQFLKEEYYLLWEEWIEENPHMYELLLEVSYGKTLINSDITTAKWCNAKALNSILNELAEK